MMVKIAIVRVKKEGKGEENISPIAGWTYIRLTFGGNLLPTV